jgi:hypothetical protein
VDDVVGELISTTQHRVPIIGLYSNRENTVVIELLDDSGATVDTSTIKVQTDSLPSSMEAIVEPVSVTEKSAYNLIQVSGQDTPYPFAFDSTGNIRWYLSMKTDGYGIYPLSNNRFTFMASDVFVQTIAKPHTAEMYEMDYLGRIHQVYYVENGIHHEVIEKTPGGNLLVLTNSNDEHLEDMVQEIDRETGDIIKSLVMTDIFGTTYVDMVDWAHLNTVSYNAETDTVILSPRNIHSGIKVNWSTNELIWILANPRFWEGTPFEDKVLQGKGDIIWHYQPHSIYEVNEDLDNNPNTMHVMMYDNHWDKTRKVDFYDNNDNSFVTLYTINEETMTVTQPHIYQGVKSKITSNYTFDYEAGRVFSMGGYLDPVIDGKNGMIYEFDYETEDILNQYVLKYTFYRGYEFVADYNDCASRLNIGTNYVKGVLQTPELAKKKLKLPEDLLENGVTFVLKENTLYMSSADHVVSQVEFIGDKQSYVLDFTSNGEGKTKYQKIVYSIPVPISGLATDTYQVVVNYKGTRMNTEKIITIN